MITLYDLSGKSNLRFSPYCWRIKYFLDFKKVEYETLPICFTERLNNPLFGDARLPLIIDDGVKISNSFDIAQYIEHKHQSSKDKAIIMKMTPSLYFINNWSDYFLNPSILERVAGDIIDILDDRDIEYFTESRRVRFGMHPKDFQSNNLKKHENNFSKCCNFLNEILQKQKYFLGNNVTYGDFIVLGSLTWGDKVSNNTVIDDKFKRLRSWKEDLLRNLNR